MKDEEILKNKIDDSLRNLDWKRLRGNNKPKLLIIGCCGAKIRHVLNIANDNHLNYNFGGELEIARANRQAYYLGRLNNPQYANDFRQNRDGAHVGVAYFRDALTLNGGLARAIDLYGGNRSPFYTTTMKKLYYEKIRDCNLHLLIVSGLYGVVKYNDYIHDYHLEMKKMSNVWGNSISQAIRNYILDNYIDNRDVFYSLSGDYLQRINPPNATWTNLWIQHDRGHTSAKCVRHFLQGL